MNTKAIAVGVLNKRREELLVEVMGLENTIRSLGGSAKSNGTGRQRAKRSDAGVPRKRDMTAAHEALARKRAEKKAAEEAATQAETTPAETGTDVPQAKAAKKSASLAEAAS